MRTADLVVGADYALRTRLYNPVLRCVVLDLRLIFDMSYPEPSPDRNVWVSRPAGRLLVAVALEGRDDETSIVPFAARPHNIVEPWAVHAAREEAEEEAKRNRWLRRKVAQGLRREDYRRSEVARMLLVHADDLEVRAQRAVNVATYAAVAPAIERLGGHSWHNYSHHGLGRYASVDVATLARLVEAAQR